MNLNKKIGFLLDNGLNPNLISSMNEGQVTTIYNRLVETKKETKEITMVSKTDTATQQKLQSEKKPYDLYEDDDEMEKDPYSDYEDSQELQQKGPSDYGDNPKLDKEMDDYDADGMGIMEKFESKAQQGLFWARCNKCESKNCKWCKMAKEFSKSTSKKQYEKMPEKKHPEKTVKYKKKKTNEEFTMANYFDKLSSVYANNAMGKTIGNLTKENIEKIIDKNLRPTMKKRDLLKLIESEIKRKKGLNEDFYMGDMDEEFDFDDMSKPKIKKPKIKIDEPEEWDSEECGPMFPEEDTEFELPKPKKKSFSNEYTEGYGTKLKKLRMGDTETDMPTRPKHRPDYTEDLPIGPDRTEDLPIGPDRTEDDDMPRPRGKMGRLRMGEPDVLEPVRIKPKREIEPETPEWEPDFDEPMSHDEDTESEPQARGRMSRLRMGEPDVLEPVRIKPKREIEPETPEWTPDEDEPIVPSPDVNPEPQAKRKKDFLNRFKDDFDRKMSRMDESTYKPIKYRKF